MGRSANTKEMEMVKRMIQIGNLVLQPGEGMEQLQRQAAKALGVPFGAIDQLHLLRQSIDARRKGNVHYVCTVGLSMPGEAGVVKSAPGRSVTLVEHMPYTFPAVKRRLTTPPVVVGMGPAGLFSALFLARNGLPPIVLERGQDVDTRTAAVEQFWQTGELNPDCNVQFGEGGAGAFSDGKLTTGTHDGRLGAVMQTLVQAGAPADILYSHKPHIGTDVLCQVVKQIRQELVELGCQIRFGHKLTGLEVEHGALSGVLVEGSGERYRLGCDALVLAPGHSARDTFAMLRDAGVPMEKKGFAIGVRTEHHQQMVSQRQYGPSFGQFPPADYKLACHLPSGRSVFTFCVCPGGQVVAAASERDGLVINGMSHRARDGKNINGGLLVGLSPADFPQEDVLAGVEFQRRWERAAFRLGGGGFRAPAQRVGDFLLERPSQGAGGIIPTYRPGVTWTQLDGCLPDYVTTSLRQALPVLDKKLAGFAYPDAVLTGVETRSSSPVRILRDEGYQSALRGLYPCGEGAGYAGGIVSAAVDGIRVAEAVALG